MAASASELLIGSFCLQILWTTLLGWLMLFPHQAWGKDTALGKRLRSRDVTSAHVDWVLLGLVQLGAAVVLERVRLPNAHAVAWSLIFNGYVAPFAYFLKAFGINAFRATGKPNLESLVGLISFAGVSAFTWAWAMLVRAWFGW